MATQCHVWSGILWPLGLAVSGCSMLNVPCGLVGALPHLLEIGHVLLISQVRKPRLGQGTPLSNEWVKIKVSCP